MLDVIRSNSKSLYIKIAFGIIILVFVFWGIGSFTDTGSNLVAKVNGSPITFQRFEIAYRNAESVARANNPQHSFTALEKQNLGRQVFYNLVEEELVNQECAKYHIDAATEEIRTYVINMPLFQNADKKFDPELYKKYLANQRMSAVQFEENVANSIRQTKLVNFVAYGKAPEVEEYVARLNFLKQRRAIEYLFIDCSQNSDVSVSQEEIENYYNTHKEDFAIPNKVKFDYVEVDPKILAEGVNVSDVLDEAIEYNILGRSFADLAQKYKVKVESSAFISQAEAQAQYGFTPEDCQTLMKTGVDTPVEIPFTAKDKYYVLRVVGTQDASHKPLTEVRNSVVEQLKFEKNLFAAKAKLEAVVKANKTPAESGFSVSSSVIERGGAMPFTSSEDVNAMIFTTEKGTWLNTIVTATKDEKVGALACRVTDIILPSSNDIDQFKDIMASIIHREYSEGVYQLFIQDLFSKSEVLINNADIIDRKNM